MTTFVIFDETTGVLAFGGATYKTKRGANQSAVAYIKRLLKRYDARPEDRFLEEARHIHQNWTVVDLDTYNARFRRTKKVVNMMSGVEVEIDVNTPACCDPSTETYWSM